MGALVVVRFRCWGRKNNLRLAMSAASSDLTEKLHNNRFRKKQELKITSIRKA